MASVAVCAELKFRDGQTEKICIKVESNLKSLIGGIHELDKNVSRLLSELVEREKHRGACAEGEEEDSDEEEESEDPHSSEIQPPSKRPKT